MGNVQSQRVEPFDFDVYVSGARLDTDIPDPVSADYIEKSVYQRIEQICDGMQLQRCHYPHKSAPDAPDARSDLDDAVSRSNVVVAYLFHLITARVRADLDQAHTAGVPVIYLHAENANKQIKDLIAASPMRSELDEVTFAPDRPNDLVAPLKASLLYNLSRRNLEHAFRDARATSWTEARREDLRVQLAGMRGTWNRTPRPTPVSIDEWIAWPDKPHQPGLLPDGPEMP